MPTARPRGISRSEFCDMVRTVRESLPAMRRAEVQFSTGCSRPCRYRNLAPFSRTRISEFSAGVRPPGRTSP